MYRWYGSASRRALAEASGWKSSLRFSIRPSWTELPSSSSSSSSPAAFPRPDFGAQHSYFATKAGGPPSRGGPPSTVKQDDEFAKFGGSDDDDPDRMDVSGYDWDYETWNLMHQGKKPHQQSRRFPLPLYKAREMVDYHMKRNRIDGLEVITDPKLEEDFRRTCHEKLVEFYKSAQAAFDEIDAAHAKGQEEKKKKKEKKLQIAGKELDKASAEEPGAEKKMNVEGEGVVDSSKEGELQSEAASPPLVVASKAEESDTDDEEVVLKESTPGTTSSLTREDETTMLASKDNPMEEFENIVKEVFGTPEEGDRDTEGGALVSMEEEGAKEASTEVAIDDGVNVFDYDKWGAYQNEERAKREEEMKKYPALRWKTQLVLGPGKAWHPANRKVTLSVYVHELGLSKYAKMRLMALAGLRYKSTKDELTIVSERYQHRYENQKDVLRTLLDLIDEAKKADKLVNDARIQYFKMKNAAALPAKSAVQRTVTLSA